MLAESLPIVKRLFRSSDDNGAGIANQEGDRELLELCSLPTEGAMARLGVPDKGLDPAQVEERRLRYGLNEIARRRRLGFVAEILQRVKNPLVIQLLVIAGVSYALGDLRAATVVGFMI